MKIYDVNNLAADVPFPNGTGTNTHLLLPADYPTVRQKYTSCRWRLGYIMTMAFTLVMMMRNCMSFAIVCMTGTPSQIVGDGSNRTSDSNISTVTVDTANFETVYTGEFNYSSETQGLLISSVFYAAIVSPLVGSFCSRKFGPKRVIFFFMTISGIIMLVTPLAARTHVNLLLATRIALGFAANTILPVSLDFWLYWAPVDEKAQLVAYSFAGFNFASVIQFAVSGFMCLIPFDNGWPFIFYLFGSITLLWCVVWILTVHERPENHPRITELEKTYIVSTRTDVALDRKNKKIPWKQMVLCKGVWAYIIVFFFHAWSTSILFSYLPLYMATVLNFDVSQNGLLSSLPYVTRSLAAFFWANISTKLTKVMSVTHTRKLIQAGGFFIAAALTIVLCYLKEGQEYIAVAIFTISAPFQVVTVNSGVVTPVDMAPQYASLITSVGMVFFLSGVMLSPMVVSYIITERTRQQWSIVFYSKVGIYCFAALVFLLIGSGELQPWADNSSKEIETKDGEQNSKSEDNVGYVVDRDEITHM